jgi:eukaryotic-like serine/threonine-protein kinase
MGRLAATVTRNEATGRSRGTLPRRGAPARKPNRAASASLAPTVQQRSGEMLPLIPSDPHGPTPAHIGTYRVLRELGEGGTGRVYLAEHELIGKRVAIKVLLPRFADDPAARRMFIDEARLGSAIRHPHLVEVYDFAVDGAGRPYCVMELAEGPTAAERLRNGPLGLSRCLEVGVAIAEAVTALHAAGVLHRDIKAENVILDRRDGRLVPKLIDFGIARRLDATAAEHGVVGTPRTMAPEQISQDPVDERTDVWALGVLLYEMLTSRLPFPTGASIRDDFVAILTEPARPLDLGFPEALRALVGDCLAKDPEDRPASAARVRDRLEAIRAQYLAEQETIERALIEDEALRVLTALEAEDVTDQLAAELAA